MRSSNVPAGRSKSKAAPEPRKKQLSQRARKGNSHTHLTRDELERMLLAQRSR